MCVYVYWCGDGHPQKVFQKEAKLSTPGIIDYTCKIYLSAHRSCTRKFCNHANKFLQLNFTVCQPIFLHACADLAGSNYMAQARVDAVIDYCLDVREAVLGCFMPTMDPSSGVSMVTVVVLLF